MEKRSNGFAKENTTTIDIHALVVRGGDYRLQIHKRSKSGSADLVLYGTGLYLCYRGAGKFIKLHYRLPIVRKRNNEKIQTGLQRYAFGYGDKEGVPKIMFWDFKKGCHYTFMMNDYKSEIDIHRTSDTKSLNHHVGILKIKYYTCIKLLQRYEKTQIELLKKYFFSRRINLEELNYMDAILFPMDHIENEDVFVEKRGKKFNLKGEIFVKDIERMYKTPEECATLKAERFQVCCVANGRLVKRGLIFKDLNRNVMYFVSERKLEKYLDAMSTSFIEIIKTANFQSKENLLALLT